MPSELPYLSKDRKIRKAFCIALIALIFSLLGLVIGLSAQQTADINNVFEIVVNNTNLAPSFVGETPGTNERISGNTYYANTSPIQILLWAHATLSGDTAEIHLLINGTKVLDISGKPLGVAESNNKSISAIIPKGASYKVDFNNYHHYEWREYPILSGKNGTLSINQTTITGGGGVSFNGSAVNLMNSTLYNGTFNSTLIIDFGTNFPNPEYGKLFLRSDLGITYIYDGSTWQSITSTFGDLHLFVHGGTGADVLGNGYNITFPCKTISYCLSLVPATSGGNVHIDIFNGTYDDSVIINGKDFRGNYNLTLDGTHSWNYLVNGTVTTGDKGTQTSQPRITVTGAGWTNFVYNNTIVLFTSGTNAGQYRLVDWNNATTLTLTGGTLPAAISGGDTFSILNWGVTIDSNVANNTYSIEVLDEKNIVINGIKLNKGFSVFRSSVYFDNLYTINPIFLTRPEIFSRTYFSSGTMRHVVFTVNNSEAGAYLNFWSVSSNFYYEGVKMDSTILGYFANSYGGLFRGGYNLINDGSVISNNYVRGVWAEADAVVNFWSGNTNMNVFIKNNNVGAYSKEASGLKDYTLYVTASYNTQNYVVDAATYGWIN